MKEYTIERIADALDRIVNKGIVVFPKLDGTDTMKIYDGMKSIEASIHEISDKITNEEE